MINKTFGQLITEYALKSEDSLQIALAIMYGCRDDIKRKVVSDFLNALEEKLKRSFPTPVWLVDNHFGPNAFVDRFHGIFLRKETWGDPSYKIGFQSQQNQAKGFFIGIMKSKVAYQPPSSLGSLKARMDEQYGAGKINAAWWAWYQDIGDGYDDWDNATTLLRLYRKEEAVEYFRSRLERIVDIVSPIIDAAA